MVSSPTMYYTDSSSIVYKDLQILPLPHTRRMSAIFSQHFPSPGITING